MFTGFADIFAAIIISLSKHSRLPGLKMLFNVAYDTNCVENLKFDRIDALQKSNLHKALHQLIKKIEEDYLSLEETKLIAQLVKHDNSLVESLALAIAKQTDTKKAPELNQLFSVLEKENQLLRNLQKDSSRVKEAFLRLLGNIEEYNVEEMKEIAEMGKHDQGMAGSMTLAIVKQTDRKKIQQLRDLFDFLQKHSSQIKYNSSDLIQTSGGKEALRLAIGERDTEIKNIFLKEIYKRHKDGKKDAIRALKEATETNVHTTELIQELKRSYKQTFKAKYLLPLLPLLRYLPKLGSIIYDNVTDVGLAVDYYGRAYPATDEPNNIHAPSTNETYRHLNGSACLEQLKLPAAQYQISSL